MGTELDTRLTAAAMRAAYFEGVRDGNAEANERNALYTAEHQLDIAARALALAADTDDDKLAGRAVQIARRAVGTTPLSHIGQEVLTAVQNACGVGVEHIAREHVKPAHELVTAAWDEVSS